MKIKNPNKNIELDEIKEVLEEKGIISKVELNNRIKQRKENKK